MTEHFCHIKDKWIPGTAASCPHHERNVKVKAFQWGKKARRSMDRQAGVVGRDTGRGYING